MQKITQKQRRVQIMVSVAQLHALAGELRGEAGRSDRDRILAIVEELEKVKAFIISDCL